MNRLIAQKMQLYRPQIDKDALQYLLEYMEGKEDIADQLLDSIFSQACQFDLASIKESLQKLTSVRDFDPAQVCEFTNVSQMGLDKFNQTAETREQIQHIYQQYMEFCKQPELFYKELAAQFDLRPMAADAKPDSVVPSVSEIIASMQSPVRLQTIENNQNELLTAVCQLLNNRFVSDSFTTLEFQQVCNYATINSFICNSNVVIMTGVFENNKFTVYNVIPPFCFRRARVQLYKIPHPNSYCFLVVKNIAGAQNLEKLVNLCRLINPVFVLFTDDYMVNKDDINILDETDGYVYPTRVSQAAESIKLIEASIKQWQCVFLTNQCMSVTPDECFERIPLGLGVIQGELVSSPCLLEFGNSRIYIQGRQIYNYLKNQSRFEVECQPGYGGTDSETTRPSVRIGEEIFHDVESDVFQANEYIGCYYLSYIQEQSLCPLPSDVFNNIYSRTVEQYDCIVTVEEFQKYNRTISGVKCINACDFESGVAVLFGMDGAVGCFYAEV